MLTIVESLASFNSRFIRFEPIKPAPPVTKIVLPFKSIFAWFIIIIVCSFFNTTAPAQCPCRATEPSAPHRDRLLICRPSLFYSPTTSLTPNSFLNNLKNTSFLLDASLYTSSKEYNSILIDTLSSGLPVGKNSSSL